MAFVQPWPAEKMERFLRLLEDGRRSSEIAKTLGITPGAVAGMKHRLAIREGRLPPRPTQPRRRYARQTPEQRVRSQIDIDLDTHAEVKALAQHNNETMSETYRELIEWGLMAVRGDRL
jgi:hypothetical protein